MIGILFLSLWLAIVATSIYALRLGIKHGNELVEKEGLNERP